MSLQGKQHSIGVIGGSGLQGLQGLAHVEHIEIKTPYSDTPVNITTGQLGDVHVAFLQRHGVGHRVPPASINVRANMAALKHIGCRQVLSLSAVGSLDENVAPGTFVVVDQFIDRTIQRQKTYFGPGLVGHVPFGDPTCARMRDALINVSREKALALRTSGTYVVMEGPQFSTKAESNLYRQWGGTIIGMTGMPEAKLAREAEMCYAMVAMATDYDCWFSGEPPVTASMISERMAKISASANALVADATTYLSGVNGEDCQCGCHRALDTAIMTAPAHRDPEMLSRFEFVVSRIRQI
ncbi:S-methyl-5'-thioadenosine phosphorylase [Dyella psychrodurans]|uniref:S-methyl-5'-thioadenosine phosphorylase n=1 Tax=Dyella psychrodurans TaxID=1927960 RepID=A0A370X2V1_9GAMM|nr:S-methyl-5'-thioadenosine phosphorylase [Dyella psychrodurans]RDS82610.1 S-methyl-5'-thioadenosine phosphorylase [Dyella psychrodurans]